MSISATGISRSAIAAIGAAALLVTAVPTAGADHYRNKHYRHGGKKIVVIHKHDHRPHWQRTRRVVHVHRHPPPRRTVTVVRHHHVYHRPRPAPAPGFDIGNRAGGMIIGAVLGAVTGSQFGKGSGRTVALLTGTVLGAVIGGEIGNSMDRADHSRVQRTLETAPTGRPVAWTNPDTGNNYSVTPTRTYRTTGNVDCRDYDAWVFIDGYEEKVRGTACRMPDGAWQKIQG